MSEKATQKQTATSKQQMPREEIEWTALDDAIMDRVMAKNRAKGIIWPSDLKRRRERRTSDEPPKHES